MISPLTTIFELKPWRVRTIFICSGVSVLGFVENNEAVI